MVTAAGFFVLLTVLAVTVGAVDELPFSRAGVVAAAAALACGVLALVARAT